MNARGPIAVVLSRFPLVTETFILREVDELERQGWPVVLVPLLRERPAVIHAEARRWEARALYSPFLSLAILRANLQQLSRRPLRYLGLLLRVLRDSWPSANLTLGTLGVFPKSVWLGEQLAARGVGHVHAHYATHPAMAARIVAELHGIPMSFTVHAHDLFVHRLGLGPKLAAARFVRAISRFNRDWILARHGAAAAAKVAVVHVGIDPARHAAAERRPEAPPLLLAVAALKPYKGLDVLIEACAGLAARELDFTGAIVGEGPLRPALERQIRAAGLERRLRLLGAQPQDEVARLLSRAALFVLPSVVASDGQMEGIPVALMEAMASRLPVVASRLSGIPELIDDGESGVLVEPGDAARLADAIADLLRDERRARALGEAAARKVAAQFRLAATVEELGARLEREMPALPGDLLADLAALLPAAERVGLRRLHRRPDSRVAELLVIERGDARERVLKVHVARAGESAPPAERARREHAMLERLGAVGVPRPLLLRAERGAILMERARGEPLDALLRRWRLHPARHAELARAVGAAGQWLARFQAATRTAAGCARHGDFWPGNIFLEADRAEVIDFEGAGEGAPERDARYFLDHLDRFLRGPLLAGLRRRLHAAFAAGLRGGA